MNLPEENKKILCANEKCKFKPSKENKYCMKHQLCLFVDETIETNKKVCANYIRGCRNQLEIDYKFNKCQECLENYRIKDKEKRDIPSPASPSVTPVICGSCLITSQP